MKMKRPASVAFLLSSHARGCESLIVVGPFADRLSCNRSRRRPLTPVPSSAVGDHQPLRSRKHHGPRTHSVLRLSSNADAADSGDGVLEDECVVEGVELERDIELRSGVSPSTSRKEEGPDLRTAALSFIAGSFVAVASSVAMFSLSLSNDDPTTQFHQNAGVLGLASASSGVISKQGADGGIADVNAQKRTAVALYRRILQQLDDQYVDDIDPNALFETSARAMLKSLDPYTEYISPQDMVKRQQLVGIGAFVMKTGGAPDTLDGKSVSSIMSNVPSPIDLPVRLLPHSQSKATNNNEDRYQVVLSLEGYAYDAGLRIGDEILEIDDHPVMGEDGLEKVREFLMGAPGTEVKITFERPGIGGVQTINVARKPVQFANVPYAGILSSVSTSNDVSTNTHGAVGYIKLRRFGVDAAISVKKAILDLQWESGEHRGLILDLRDNSGGELLSAVQIASLFFPEGMYLGSSQGHGSMYPNEVYRSGRVDLAQYGYAIGDKSNSKSRQRVGMTSSGDDGVFLDGKQVVDPGKTKIVVLVNEKTASASEFLAGAFQDLDRGVILGNDISTMGKGIGQREIGLPNGGGALKLTYHQFYTPSGRCVQKQYRNGAEKSSQGRKEVFSTQSGRTVRNRNGIEVDYRVKSQISQLGSMLSSSGAYYEFAQEYCSRHPLPPGGISNENFVLEDSVYNDFKSFVMREQKRGNLKLDENFDDQHLLQNIETIETISAASTSRDSSSVPSRMVTLRSRLVQDLLTDLDSSKDAIQNELEQNILARRLSDGELIRRSLKSDEVVKEAVKIIENAGRYQELLGRSG